MNLAKSEPSRRHGRRQPDGMDSPRRAPGAILLACWLSITGCATWSANGIPSSSSLPAESTRQILDAESPADSSAINDRSAGSPIRTVRVDGRMAVIGDATPQTISAAELSNRLTSLLEQSRFRSAGTVVRNHPDVAVSLLESQCLGRTQADGNPPIDRDALRFLARTLDRLYAIPAASSYVSLLEAAEAGSEAITAYQLIRAELDRRLHAESVLDAESIGPSLVEAADRYGHAAARIEARRLASLEDLVAENAAAALDSMRSAADVAEQAGYLHSASRCWLSCCDLARRSEDPRQEVDAWNRAVSLQLKLAGKDPGNSRPEPAYDLSFWVDAEQLRPATMPWPSDCHALNHWASPLVPASALAGANSELSLRLSLIAAMLRHGDARSALLHCKRAGGIAPEHLRPWLRIVEAQCLVVIGAQPAATAILMDIALRGPVDARQAAHAALGSHQLSRGAFQEGRESLRRALAVTAIGEAAIPVADWPGATAALADLALADLILGDTERGLQRLREAQRRLLTTLAEPASDALQYRQMLENEIRICEAEQRPADGEAAVARLRAFEQSERDG